MATATLNAKTFEYRGRNTSGKVVKGKLEASNEAAAAERVRSMGLAPIGISETVAGSGLNRDISIEFLSKGVGLKDLAIMSRQAATMVSAGLSLLRALAILAEQSENAKLKTILSQVARDVETGWSLSDAMGKHPRDFPPLMVNMIRAGETGGFLEGALETIATNYEKEHKLRSTIKSAMMYPIMVLILSLVSVVIMLTFIVPIFKDMFEGMGGQLPLPTQFLVSLSQAMPWILLVGVPAGIGFAIWWRANKHTDRVRKFLDPIKLKLPVFGSLMKKIAITRFSRNLSDMIAAGVPILQALVIVGETSGNWVIEEAARSVANSVRQGKSIAGPLAEEPVFPAMVVQMVAVGEDSGALEIMLKKIADFYDAEVEAMTEALTSLIEPLLIAFLGILVGGMIVALYLPIFNIITLVK